jgi:hypothetical protein
VRVASDGAAEISMEAVQFLPRPIYSTEPDPLTYCDLQQRDPSNSKKKVVEVKAMEQDENSCDLVNAYVN